MGDWRVYRSDSAGPVARLNPTREAMRLIVEQVTEGSADDGFGDAHEAI